MKTITAVVEATVTYTCELNEEQTNKVLTYIGDTDLCLKDAIIELYFSGNLDLYNNSTESDFSTEAVTEVKIKEGAE